MKSLTGITLAIAFALLASVADASSTKPSSFAPHWSEVTHSSSSPKRHSPHNPPHKSGHHVNPRTGNHNTHHAPGSN